MWDVRSDQTLTLADYLALGDGERSGLSVALARRAEATLRRLSAAQTDIARRILLRLISFGEGRSDTRRQQARAQLCSASDDVGAFAFVLQAMVEDPGLAPALEPPRAPGRTPASSRRWRERVRSNWAYGPARRPSCSRPGYWNPNRLHKVINAS